MNNEQNQNGYSGDSGTNNPGDVYSQRYAHHHVDGSDYSKSQYQQSTQEGQTTQYSQSATNTQSYAQQQPYYQQAAHSAGATTYATAGNTAAQATVQPQVKSSSGKTFLIAFAGALVACILVIGVAFGFGVFDVGGSNSATVNIGSTNGQSVDASDVDTTLAEAVSEKCLPSVASITVLGTQQSSGNSIYDFLYGNNNNNNGELSEIGMGSGVILSEDGYIITNYHVVEDGQQYKATIQGEDYEVELVGSDTSSDVAVLKVKDGNGFTPIEIGDSDEINIGEWVMSIGCPFGLEQSVATGIVSATSRSQIMDSSTDMFGNSTGETTIYPNMIQTDAAINPGNSGGALVNADGQLIGINTLITSYSGNYSGVGFAIPSNYAISLAQSIISGEEPTHAQLGISMTTVNSSISKRYGFATDEGAYVSSVVSGSAADEAGFEVGDIIVAFDGEKVSSASDVMLDVRTKNPGDSVTITVNRDGQTQDLQVTLGQSEAASSSNNTQQNNSNNNSGRNGNSWF